MLKKYPHVDPRRREPGGLAVKQMALDPHPPLPTTLKFGRKDPWGWADVWQAAGKLASIERQEYERQQQEEAQRLLERKQREQAERQRLEDERRHDRERDVWIHLHQDEFEEVLAQGGVSRWDFSAVTALVDELMQRHRDGQDEAPTPASPTPQEERRIVTELLAATEAPKVTGSLREELRARLQRLRDRDAAAGGAALRDRNGNPSTESLRQALARPRRAMTQEPDWFDDE